MVVDGVVTVGFEEKMTDLAGQHREPADQSGHSRIAEEKRIAAEKNDGADQMQRLIDAALMIVAIIVEALRPQHCHEIAHDNFPLSKADIGRHESGVVKR